MRVSVSWLKELVEFDFSPEALAEALTMAGFEVEEIEDRAQLGRRGSRRSGGGAIASPRCREAERVYG